VLLALADPGRREEDVTSGERLVRPVARAFVAATNLVRTIEDLLGVPPSCQPAIKGVAAGGIE
jgi:hypothetical protein